MSLYSGSLGYKKYFVIGLEKSFSIAEIDRLQKPFRFSTKKLSHAVQPEFCGWARPANGDIGDEVDSNRWSASDAQLSNAWTLRMCCVRRKVPSLFLKMTLEERLAQLSKKELESMTRSSRKELKDQIQHELLSQALPQFTFVDAVWRDKTHELYVFTNSKAQIARFENLFMKTFGHPMKLDIISDGYFTNRFHDIYAQSKNKQPKAKALLDSLSELQPSRFAIHAHTVVNTAMNTVIAPQNASLGINN